MLGAIAAGYTDGARKIPVLFQPAELVIIFGAAIGTVVIANPLAGTDTDRQGLAGVFAGSPFTKARYLET